MTVKYVRQVKGYGILKTEDEISGDEVYVRDDNHAAGVVAASLPIIGTTTMKDTDDSAISSCVCRTMQAAYDDSDLSTVTLKYHFSTKKGGVNPTQNIPDSSVIRFDAGCETIAISQSVFWKDYADPVTAQHPEIFPATLSKIIPIVNFAISATKSASTNDAYFTILLAAIGRINSAAMTRAPLGSFELGSILFVSFSGGSAITSTGAQQYVYELHFAAKVLSGIGSWSAPASAANGAWNATWNNRSAAFDIPQNSASGGGDARAYGTYDLNTLLS